MLSVKHHVQLKICLLLFCHCHFETLNTSNSSRLGDNIFNMNHSKKENDIFLKKKTNEI